MISLALGAATVAVVLSTPSSATVRVGVLRDVEVGTGRINSDDADLQQDSTVEPHVAANPEDPLHAVVVFQVARAMTSGAGAIGLSVTRDGGRTWRQQLLPRTTLATGGDFLRASDPVVAFGLGGVDPVRWTP